MKTIKTQRQPFTRIKMIKGIQETPGKGSNGNVVKNIISKSTYI